MPAPKQNAAKRARTVAAKKDEPNKVGTTLSKSDGDSAKEVIVRTTTENDGTSTSSKGRSKFPTLGNGDAREPEDEEENVDEVSNEGQVESMAQKKPAAEDKITSKTAVTKSVESEAAAGTLTDDQEDDDESCSSNSSEEESKGKAMVPEQSSTKQGSGKGKASNKVMATVPKKGGRRKKVTSPNSKASPSASNGHSSEDEGDPSLETLEDTELDKDLYQFVNPRKVKKAAQKVEASKENGGKVDNDERSTKEVEEPVTKRGRGKATKKTPAPKQSGRRGKVQPEPEYESEPRAVRHNFAKAAAEDPENASKKRGFRTKTDVQLGIHRVYYSKEEMHKASSKLYSKMEDAKEKAYELYNKKMQTAIAAASDPPGNVAKKGGFRTKGDIQSGIDKVYYSEKEMHKTYSKLKNAREKAYNQSKKIMELPILAARREFGTKSDRQSESENSSEEEFNTASDKESKEDEKMAPPAKRGRGNAAKKAPRTKLDAQLGNSGEEECNLSSEEKSKEDEKIAPPAKKGRKKVTKKAPVPKKGRATKKEIEPKSDSASESGAMAVDLADVKDDDDDDEIEKEEKVEKPVAIKVGRKMKVEPEPESKGKDKFVDRDDSFMEKQVRAALAKQPETKRGKAASAKKKDLKTSEKAEPTAAKKRGRQVVAEKAIPTPPDSDDGEDKDEQEPPKKIAPKKAKKAAPKKLATSRTKKATTAVEGNKK